VADPLGHADSVKGKVEAFQLL